VKRTAAKRQLESEREDETQLAKNSSWDKTMKILLRSNKIRRPGGELWKRQQVSIDQRNPSSWNKDPQGTAEFQEATRIGQNDEENDDERLVDKRANVGAAGLVPAEHISLDNVLSR